MKMASGKEAFFVVAISIAVRKMDYLSQMLRGLSC